MIERFMSVIMLSNDKLDKLEVGRHTRSRPMLLVSKSYIQFLECFKVILFGILFCLFANLSNLFI